MLKYIQYEKYSKWNGIFFQGHQHNLRAIVFCCDKKKYQFKDYHLLEVIGWTSMTAQLLKDCIIERQVGTVCVNCMKLTSMFAPPISHSLNGGVLSFMYCNIFFSSFMNSILCKRSSETLWLQCKVAVLPYVT